MISPSSSRVRSKIIKVPDANPGLLFLNGQQQAFTLEGVWRSPVAPAANMTVDVELGDGGTIAAITVVDSQQIARERMARLSGTAEERGQQVATLAGKGFRELAARMGVVPLACAVLVWMAWFFIPVASLEADQPITFTFWRLIGIDFKDLERVASGGSHGLFSIVGLAALAAPFAVPYLRAAWSKYLNAAPLAFVVLSLIIVFFNEHSIFSKFAAQTGVNPYSWSGGVVVLPIVCAILALGALKNAAQA